MKKFLAVVTLVALLASCNDSAKKVVVFSKGDAAIDTDAKTITATDGAGHTEKIFVLGSGSYVFKLSTPAGEANVELKENGMYVVNVKNDTIVGSYQKYSDPSKANATITQADLLQRIDSLQQLMEGKNVSAANRNFFVLPKYAVKVSDNTSAEVVGPYHQMISAEKKDGKEPEIYRFYSIKEIREMVLKLQKLTIPEKI